MKRFLIPLLAALALPTTVEANWFGKYGSSQEASRACTKWIYKGRGRFCQIVEETNQVLGYSSLLKVKKRFKYYTYLQVQHSRSSYRVWDTM